MRLADNTPNEYIFRCSAAKFADLPQFCEVLGIGARKGGYERVGVVQPPLCVFRATAKGESFSSFQTRISTA